MYVYKYLYIHSRCWDFRVQVRTEVNNAASLPRARTASSRPPTHTLAGDRIETNSFSAATRRVGTLLRRHHLGPQRAAEASGSTPPTPRRPMCQRLLFYVGVVVGGACSDPPPPPPPDKLKVAVTT